MSSSPLKVLSVSDLNRRGLLEGKPILKPEDTEVDKLYPIIDFTEANGKYGEQTVVELQEHIVYLPKRMRMAEELMESLRCKQLALVYRGMKDVEKYKKKTPLYEIVENWTW